jgi:hypothetical protein
MLDRMAKAGWPGVLASTLGAALLAAVAVPAAAQHPTCVTRCQQKVDACAAQCEALADAVYREPASLRECQLACARQLFVTCVEHCTETGEVVQDDFGMVAEDPDRIPKAPKAPESTQ